MDDERPEDEELDPEPKLGKIKKGDKDDDEVLDADLLGDDALIDEPESLDTLIDEELDLDEDDSFEDEEW